MKKVLNILKKIIYAIVMLCIVITPFLHKIFDQDFAEIIFYFSIGVFIVVTLFDKNNDLIENCLGTIYICFLFISFFVINYYNTKYDWFWFVFILVLLLIPGAIFLYYKYIWNSQKIKEVNKLKLKKIVIRYCVLFAIADLFYMGIFTENTILIIVFGVILLVDDLYHLTKAFLLGKEKYSFLIIIDFVLAIFATIFLIFSIPNIVLQNIVTSLISAIYGGILTLVGVAWTIKDNKHQFLETQRKENIPYLVLHNDTVNYATNLEVQIITENENTYSEHSFDIYNFIVKTSNNCIFEGVLMNNQKYEFKQKKFTEKNSFAQVKIIEKYIPCQSDFNVTLDLLVSDMSGNLYKYNCTLNENGKILGTSNSIPVKENHRSYKVINILIPSILEKNNS